MPGRESVSGDREFYSEETANDIETLEAEAPVPITSRKAIFISSAGSSEFRF